jgi:hypothetical protein
VGVFKPLPQTVHDVFGIVVFETVPDPASDIHVENVLEQFDIIFFKVGYFNLFIQRKPGYDFLDDLAYGFCLQSFIGVFSGHGCGFCIFL